MEIKFNFQDIEALATLKNAHPDKYVGALKTEKGLLIFLDYRSLQRARPYKVSFVYMEYIGKNDFVVGRDFIPRSKVNLNGILPIS